MNAHSCDVLVDEINRALNDVNHDHLCACADWADNRCPYYRHGQWDEDSVLSFALGYLESKGLLK